MKPTKHHRPDKTKAESTLYGIASNLNDEERITAPLKTVLNEGHPQVISNAIDATERAKAKASLHESQQLAGETGLSQITDEEINQEIRLVRAARCKRAAQR